MWIALEADAPPDPEEEDNPFSEPSVARTSSRQSQSTDHSDAAFPVPRRKSSRSFIAQGNATFLTECSFEVAHDALIKHITDAEPYLVHWERLKRIDLSGKGIDSVARLKEFLPLIEQVDLNNNRISWLTGLPSTVLRLSIASNALTGLAAYNHIPRLQYLNISHNQVETFQLLNGLVNLRELHADYNCLTSLDGLESISLRVLTVRGNDIRNVDMRMTQWHDLEILDLSQNRICDIQGVDILQSLVTLNLDGNRLEYFSVLGSRLPALRALRLSDNRLTTLNVFGLDSLRTLYADNNKLSEVIGLEDCHTVHNLSLRNQSQKLYVRRNPLPTQFFCCPLPNLIYAELSSCQLATLPVLRQMMPHIMTLVLNWNHFRHLDFLADLRHLQRVVAVGCRVETLEMDPILGGLRELRELDLRMNTFTLGWYLPVKTEDDRKHRQQATTGGKTSEHDLQSSSITTPEDLDKKYRRGLPDELYVPRAMWRGLAMECCPTIDRLDGLDINDKERIKIRKLLVQLRQSGLVLDRPGESM
ncbi:L domain-like protein [Dacryopinax primogenitus]|uniref:L domain-like protein n=1 Tax=Dacryopinax primogenitus (strain DJM 731) TaxID=1858805 RepID=M5G4H1_DACPD|nr:L domain-like protein [Dacryopinax primogenitus]EJU03130.1 L domain-like protein [Dacryopinax primogenitus]